MSLFNKENNNADMSNETVEEMNDTNVQMTRREKRKLKKAKKREKKTQQAIEKQQLEAHATGKTTMNLYKALTEKITGMGYSYSMLSLFKSLIFFSAIIVVLGYFHKLKIYYIFILILIVLGLLPFSIYYQYKYLYEQKRFNELKTYLKFMRLNFKQSKKIVVALEDTLDNFDEENEMYFLIKKAIEMIYEGQNFRAALEIIEKPFKNSYITKLHAYMILAETEGGESAFDALDTIDFEAWESDTYIYQTQKYKYQNQNQFYTLLGLGISLAVIFVFDSMMADSSTASLFGGIYEQTIFQLVTFIYIAIDIISFVMIKSIITGKWIREDE